MIFWIIATLVAFYIKGLCGFANTLVFTTIMTFGDNNINISPTELLIGYPSNLILAWRERKSIDLKICLPLATLVILGGIPGIIFLKNVDATIVKIICGFVIAAVGIEMLLREKSTKKHKQSTVVMIIVGIISGVLCGIYGIGILLATYLSRVAVNTSSFKANLCIVFSVENTFRIVMYCIAGIITLDILKQALILIPVMLVGLGLGIISGKIIDEKLAKRIVIIMLIISGVALIINNLV